MRASNPCVFSLWLFLPIFPLPYGQGATVKTKPTPGSSEFWLQLGKQELLKSMRNKPIVSRAKNLLLFIGDGMSIPTVTAARIWKAQKNGQKRAEETLLEFEDVPYVALSKTHTEDFIVPDSAATATSMLSGVKINSLTVGVDARVKFTNCSSYTRDADLKNIFTYAKEAGMATGLVTTTSLTHATPSAAYGHSASRYWMSDKDLKKQVPEGLRSKCTDLASQFLTNALDIDVALAGGYKKFVGPDKGGEREDGRDIPSLWLEKQRSLKRVAKFVRTKKDLWAVADDQKLNRLLGIFSDDNMPYIDERKDPKFEVIPTLKEMVSAALSILKRQPKGFFLLVEGGRIDHAHHYGYGQRALEEVLGMDEAYAEAKRSLNPLESLFITTADHAHTFSIGGYPSRGSNIFGFPDQNTEGKGRGKAKDGMPFTIILYANGPGAKENGSRNDLTNVNTKSITYRQQAIVPLKKETHGGDDVGIWASGPMAHLVAGVREQNFIYNVFMNAACLGHYSQESHCAGARLATTSTFFLACYMLIHLFHRE